jgi:hypothetical protein
VRRPITDAERLEAYASAIHGLIGTICSMKSWAMAGMARPEQRPPMEVYEKIIGLAEGRLEATSGELEPVYTGYVREVVKEEREK